MNLKRAHNPAAVPLLALALAVTAACGGGSDDDAGDGGSPTQTSRPEAQEFEMSAADFAFSPDAIELEPGQSLDIQLTNDGEALHTFTLDELNIDVEVQPGDEVDVPLTASEPGQFTFYCRFHDSQGMTGTLRIGVPEGGEADATDAAESSPTGGSQY